MANEQRSDFFPNLRNPENIRVINDRCLIRSQDDYCVVLVSGIVLAQYALSDHMAEAYAMVSLVEQGANPIDPAPQGRGSFQSSDRSPGWGQ